MKPFWFFLMNSASASFLLSLGHLTDISWLRMPKIYWLIAWHQCFVSLFRFSFSCLFQIPLNLCCSSFVKIFFFFCKRKTCFTCFWLKTSEILVISYELSKSLGWGTTFFVSFWGEIFKQQYHEFTEQLYLPHWEILCFKLTKSSVFK